jgi:uncharacterized sulfatase
MMKNQQLFPTLFDLGFAQRGEEQLFDVQKDPFCLHDLASDKRLGKVKMKLKKQLDDQLLKQGDPRSLGKGDVFEGYPRFGLMKDFDGFKERAKYNPAYTNK